LLSIACNGLANPPVPPQQRRMQTFALTALAMLAFAANSLLTRLGVAGEGMDAGLFAVVRVASGAVGVVGAGPAAG
jgi:hypothetical protein